MSGAAPRVAVITGGHPFDVPGFHRFVGAIAGAAFTPLVQHLDDFATSPPGARRSYAAVLFYFFPQGAPQGGGIAGDPARAIEDLLDAGQGVVVLHHALLAYPAWPLWDEVVGCAGRDRFSYHPGTRYEARVVEGDHPIVQGIAGWEMTDETYVMPAVEGAPLLAATHPLSSPVIAWTRTCRGSRVACLQPGHDDGAWSRAGFQQLVAQALYWTSRRD
jgi:type 1 glutamine amidotransferase